MKRLVSIFLAAALMLMAFDAMAQTVKLKRYAKTLNMKTGTKVWEYNTGLKIVGKNTKVYIMADTAGSGATPVTSFTWAFDGVPAGSVAAMDSGSSFPMYNSFTVDTTGYYYLALTVNGTVTSRDTIYASTYVGVDRYKMFDFAAGCICHSGAGTINTKFNEWQNSNHATIFFKGVTGQLEVEADPTTGTNYGAYKETCVQCHTVGFEPTANNGNWAYKARVENNWYDTTWSNHLPVAGGDVWILTGDTTSVWTGMNTTLRPTANIGCENCHGPLAQHKATGSKAFVAIELDPDNCNVCHDGSTKHSIGSYFRGSKHSAMVQENGANCAPCHTGGSFVKWSKIGKPIPFPSAQYSAATMDNTNTTCAVCHEPHTMELRVTSLDSLRNGWVPPAGTGGAGALCMNCHQSRTNNATAYVKPASSPYFGFKSRFYPHHSNQTDMLLGHNLYEFGDSKLTGISTHASLEDGCVTCHMGLRNGLPNHQFSMDPTNPNYTLLGGTRNYNPVTACATCHGDIEDYNDIKAGWDYDKDGTVEGVEMEVEGLLETLKARLPQRDGAVIGEGSVNAADSAAVMGRLDLVEGIFTYYSVEFDASKGMHNAKYTVSLLQKALGIYPLAVDRTDLNVPDSYKLSQNFPNPFNPTTNIQFAIPRNGQVRLDVYDILGNHVSTLVNEQMGAGNFQTTWNGMDKNGQKVATGMYIYRMQVDNSFQSVKKMLLVK